MKKILSILTIILAISSIAVGCGGKTLHCDGCGEELKVSNSSNMDEDWIVFCKDCEEELFEDNPIVEESK